MNCAIVIRGAHYDFLENKIDYKSCFQNHIQTIFEPLKTKGFSFDVFLLTYESPVIHELFADYAPFKTYVLNKTDQVVGGTWYRQTIWHTESIKLLRNAEEEKGVNYDYVLNTRFDILFPRPLFEYSLDLHKINIMYKHLSGNCDDNFFFLPRRLLDLFELAFQTLLKERRITHEVCRFLPETQINYLYLLPKEDKELYEKVLAQAFVLTRKKMLG